MSAVQRKIEEIGSIDWDALPHQAWGGVVRVLQELSLEPDHERTHFQEALLPLLQRLLNADYLLKLWSRILSMSVENGTSEGSSLLNGFRLMANAYKFNLPASLQHQAYVTSVLRSLSVAIRDLADVNAYTIDGVISGLTDANTVVFLTETVALDEGHAVISLLCGITNPIWLLNAAKIVLKLIMRLPICDKPGLKSALRSLVRSSVERGVSAGEIAEALVLVPLTPRQAPRALYTSIAEILLESIPSTAVPEVLDATLLLWGDKLFVSRADVPRMAYLTEVVVASLARCDRRQLAVTGSRHLPVELALSMGISNYLEVDNITIRVHGMRAAVAYAKLVGEPLHFAELEALDAEEARQSAVAAAPSSSSSGSNASLRGQTDRSNAGKSSSSSTTAHTAHHADTSVGYDTDSSEELVGYDVEEEDTSAGVFNYKDKLLVTNYLRDCLQMLRCPDSKPEARQQLHAALVRIPVIMATNPPDARDLCVPLVKELLTVANAFNIEDFDNLRTAALQSILQPHASQAVPFLTGALQGQELPLGLKLVVVDWLMAAARDLSDIPEFQQLTSREEEGLRSGARGIAVSNEKVRIKRPTVLANSKKRTRYFRNEFGPLAHLFIHPLMGILGRAWHNTLNEPLLPRTGDEFNLISEMFGPTSPQKSGKAPVEAVKDMSLSHLDGVDALLPSQCLVALGLFARCSVNTANQRDHALQVIKAASAYRNASAVALRRAALYALRLSMEAYLPSAVSKSANASAAARAQLNRGPLDSLLHISESDVDVGSGLQGYEDIGGMSDAAALSIMNQPVIIECVDWAASTWKEDPDEVSRTLKHEIVNIAVKGLS